MRERISLLCVCLLSLLLCNCGGSSSEPEPVPAPEGDYINREETFASFQGWKFRCKVLAESRTVEDAGGRIAFMKKVDDLMERASGFFRVKGINDAQGNQVLFYMSEFEVFEGRSGDRLKEPMRSNESYDLKIVMNARASSADKSSGFIGDPCLSIGLDRDNLFSKESLMDLVYSLALSRGVVGVDQAVVRDGSVNNPVNGQDFRAVPCIMNDRVGTEEWSDYAKSAINASGDKRVVSHRDYLPGGIRTQVLTHEGQVAKDALLRFYPVYPGSGTVGDAPLFDGQLSATGNYVFSSNPFLLDEGAREVYNYLVEVIYERYKFYFWMPVYEVEQSCISAPGVAYTYKIRLPKIDESTYYIPEGDYVDRKVEFDRLRGWKFRCKVFVEKQTMADYGGRMQMLKKMDRLLQDASAYFQVKGINDEGGNQFHFYMTEMLPFEGRSSALMYDTSGESDLSYDVRVVVNAHAADNDVSGGWLPAPYLCVGHDFSGLFQGYAVDALVHEFGHSRGMIDLYATEVNQPSGNPITGETYEAEKGLMNYPYGETAWSAYSLMMINASADRRVCLKHHTFLSPDFNVKVLEKDGRPAVGARLKFYPVEGYSYKVTTAALYEGETSSQGVFSFGTNPFVKPGQSDRGDNIFNYYVEIEYGGVKTYRWMPIQDAELEYGTKGSDTLVFILD